MLPWSDVAKNRATDVFNDLYFLEFLLAKSGHDVDWLLYFGQKKLKEGPDSDLVTLKHWQFGKRYESFTRTFLRSRKKIWVYVHKTTSPSNQSACDVNITTLFLSVSWEQSGIRGTFVTELLTK